MASKTIITPRGRLSYPHLFERNTKGEYPSDMYETLLLIPKSTDIKALRDAATEVMTEAFKDKFKSIDDLKHPPIRDGDDYDDDRKGHWIIKAKTDNRPQIVGADPKVVIDDSEECYGGRWARLSMSCYSYDKAGSKGVSFGLKNVQLLDHAEKFGGGGGDPASQFGEEKVEEAKDGF